MAAMTASQMRAFIEEVKRLEQGNVTPAPWKMVRNKEGNIRTRAVDLGRVDHVVTSFCTDDGSYTSKQLRMNNVNLLLHLRNGISGFIQGLEAGTTPSGAPTYTPNPSYIAHAYVMLNGVVRLGGIEEIRYALTKSNAYLQPIVGITSSAPYNATNIATARTALCTTLLATIPDKDTVAAMDASNKATLLNTLKAGINAQLPTLKTPGTPAVPVNADPTLIHYADIILRSLAGMYMNGYQLVFAPWKDKAAWDALDAPGKVTARATYDTAIKQDILDKITEAANLLTPVDYVPSCEPYIAADVATTKTALEAIVTAGTGQTIETILNAVHARAATFARGYVPMLYTPTDIQTISLSGESKAGVPSTR